MAPRIQTIVFPRAQWTTAQAREWLRRHDYATGVDQKANSLRFRQMPPPRSGRYVTREVFSGRKSIALVLWYPPGQ